MRCAEEPASRGFRSPIGACSGPLQFEAFLSSGLRWDRSRRCAVLGADSMAMFSASASPFCRPEEDPFLLLESTLRSMQEILLRRRGLPLRRTWIEHPYGEEELTLLEEEVLPAIQRCMARVEEIDQALQLKQDLEVQQIQLAAGREQRALMAEAGVAGMGH